MRKWTLMVSLLAGLALVAVACKKDEGTAKKPDKPAAATADAAPAGGGAVTPAGTGGTGGGKRAGGGGGEPGPGGPGSGTGGGHTGGSSGKMDNKMANCPSAVTGATTTVAEGAGAVEVTVVGADEAGTNEIRARAKKLAESSMAPAAAEAAHSGKGTGGGAVGFCPVVLAETTVEYAEVDKGAKLTVKPAKPENLKALVEESKRRNENMPKAGAAPEKAPEPAKGGEKAPEPAKGGVTPN